MSWIEEKYMNVFIEELKDKGIYSEYDKEIDVLKVNHKDYETLRIECLFNPKQVGLTFRADGLYYKDIKLVSTKKIVTPLVFEAPTE